MDYLLHNMRTGEAHLLDPPRALIGTARHATLRTLEGGPFLAALVVRYPGGWAVHGLSDDPSVLFNRTPLGLVHRATPWPGDVLTVGDDRFRFVAAAGPPDQAADTPDPPACFAYVRYPDGMEECRAVDHDLLFGRRSVCHVRLPDKRLSRITALLASHAGQWYLHALAHCPVARNGELIDGVTPIDDGDELLIGPLTVRIELRVPEAAPPVPCDPADATETVEDTPRPDVQPDLTTLHAAGVALDLWLRGHQPTAAAHAGIGGWLEAQRERLQRFWFDTPDATAARALRAAGRVAEAFTVLDRAIRARPDSPQLLRELNRLYDSVGLSDLCYRPLRQIEKLATAHGGADVWVLEALARVCERLGEQSPDMFDRAVAYWNKLEAASGVSYARERTAVLATRALREGGFASAGDGALHTLANLHGKATNT